VTVWRLLARNLLYYWRTGLMVALGVAIATAVITGSLIVGDSVRGSLRDTALARLGAIDLAVTAPHLFREALGDEFRTAAHMRRTVAVYQTRGAVTAATSEAVAPRVNVYGVTTDFFTLFASQSSPSLTGRQVAINNALARDLLLVPGDMLLVSVNRETGAPADSLFAQRKRAMTVRTLRVRISAVMPDHGVGGFGLFAASQTPRNLFCDLHWLQEQLGIRGRVNALLCVTAHGVSTGLQVEDAALTQVSQLPDAGLQLLPNTAQGYFSVQSDSMLLTAATASRAVAAARAQHLHAAQTSMYLATSMQKIADPHARLAYALIAGSEPLAPYAFSAGDGKPLDDHGIWLNQWAATDLGASVGEQVEVQYLIPAWDGIYRSGSARYVVRGIVRLTGAATDRGLAPAITGITDARSVSDWQPPFPIDLRRITPRDDAYWSQYRTAPKAYLSLNSLRALWASGPQGEKADWLTSVRVAVPVAQKMATTMSRFAAQLRQALPPRQAGLTIVPVRRLALTAAKGSTDFSALFLSLGFFIIAAALALAIMMMRLLIDRRAAEVGILLACGMTTRWIARLLLGEGTVLAFFGALAGAPLGFVYGWGIVRALTTWWTGALADTPLWFHWTGASLGIGGGVGCGVGIIAAWWSLRALRQRRILSLLAGWQAVGVIGEVDEGKVGRRLGHRGRILAWSVGCFTLLAALALALAGGRHAVSPTTAFFGAGTAMLGTALTGAWLLLTTALSRRFATPSFLRLAMRNAAANRGRSLLIFGLLACASFLIITVAANTRDFSRVDPTDRRSGTGGFSLLATSSLPILYDFGTRSGRANLGFSPEDEAIFAGVDVMPFLVSPGDDVSCLNLAATPTPRILGVPPAMIARGGFTVQTAMKLEHTSPWKWLDISIAEGEIPAFGDADTVMWSLNSGLGEKLLVPGADGRSRTLRFVGLLNTSVLAGNLLVGQAQFAQMYPGIHAPRVFLLSTPPARERAVAEVLRRILGDQGLEVRGTREVLNDYARVQNTYLATFLALGGLGIFLGTLGLVVVVLRNALERRKEFALLLAIGFTRGEISRLLLLENISLLLFGQICGAIAALLAVAPQLVTSGATVPWVSILGILGGNLLLGAGASALAALAATRGDMLRALREE